MATATPEARARKAHALQARLSKQHAKAKLAGTSKTTLTRAIRAGRLSATRRDDGGYAIDPAELCRVYTVAPATPETGAATGRLVHHATPAGDATATPCDPTVTARLAALDAEVRGLRDLLAEVRPSRDSWQQQAERATLVGLDGPAADILASPNRCRGKGTDVSHGGA